MDNLLNKGNTFYFIASSLATLTLLTSLMLINVPSALTFVLAVLSALALIILYKIIIDTRKVGKEFAHKERELTQEKHNLYEEGRKFGQKIEAERKSFLKEKKSLEEKLEAKMSYIIGITDELEKVTKEKDELAAQEKELLHKISYLCKQLQEKEANSAEREKLITELKRKIDNNKYIKLKNEELHKEIEKLSKEKEKLSKEIDKLRKEKYILNERQKELYVELDELQCKIKEINHKNKNLSQELKRKFEELCKADDLIKDQSFELDRIRQDCNNQVKSLRNLLLEQDSQIKQLQYMVDKAEESIRENEAVKDYSKKIVLQKTQITPVKGSKTSGETSDSLQKDLGYESLPASCLSTPTKSPNSLLTESYRLNQGEGICKT